jgi:hypothetical protein
MNVSHSFITVPLVKISCIILDENFGREFASAQFVTEKGGDLESMLTATLIFDWASISDAERV